MDLTPAELDAEITRRVAALAELVALDEDLPPLRREPVDLDVCEDIWVLVKQVIDPARRRYWWRELAKIDELAAPQWEAR